MCRTLAVAGHQVSSAADCTAGLALYRDRPTDVVIADVFERGQWRLGLVEAIFREGSCSRIIATSEGWGREAFDALQHAKRLGADLALTKPIPPDVLATAVSELLGLDSGGPAPSEASPRQQGAGGPGVRTSPPPV